MSAELAFTDATDLAARVRSKELSPVEIVRALRERAGELNPTLNALVTPIEDAEQRAHEAEAAVLRGDDLGPLHGVPFTVKDSFDTAGTRTTRGSRLFADRVPDADAVIVARLKAAGGIALAKTNAPEFALWWETDNLVFGRTANPWNVERTAGGSSGGEASAIAAGLSPLGLGSDLGGSIRGPAHYCGVVGLKATHGRVPLTGHWPDTILRFMHAGPMARTVRDAALALSVVCGPDGDDWHALPLPGPAVPEPGRDLRGTCVLRLADVCFGPIDPEVSAAVDRAGRALEEQGAAVEEGRIEAIVRNDWNLKTLVLYGCEGSVLFVPLIAGHEDELHPVLRRRLAERKPPPLADYLEVEAEVELLRAETTEALSRFDLLLCPSTGTPAYLHGQDELVIAGETVPSRSTLRTTIPFNLTGSPALSLPFASSAEGLPIGVQLVGRRFGEEALFRIALALEQSSEVAGQRPPL
jgi:Asp-tRNA(Asn)/Glu-tRNA(Gln) amidotransferase A subunit family amidase